MSPPIVYYKNKSSPFLIDDERTGLNIFTGFQFKGDRTQLNCSPAEPLKRRAARHSNFFARDREDFEFGDGIVQ